MNRSILVSLTLGISISLLGGCDYFSKSTPSTTSNDSKPAANRTGANATPMAGKSLYERLGGEAAITAVCEDFVGRAAANPAVNFFRKGVPGSPEWKPTPEQLSLFKKHLVQFVCSATGGPQKYEGADMKSSHAGMKITEAEFVAIANDLALSLDKFKIPQADKDALLAIVATTKNDIVELKGINRL